MPDFRACSETDYRLRQLSDSRRITQATSRDANDRRHVLYD